MSTQIALQQHSINMKNFSVVSQRLLVINTERVYFQNIPNSSDISIIYISRYSLCKLPCILVARAWPCNGLFHFLPIQGYGREIPRGRARNIFPGSQGLKLSFQGGQGRFSRGIIQVRGSLPVGSYLENCFLIGHFWYHPSGIPVQKQIYKTAFHTPVWIKNGIAQYLI